ncbi:MAG TPA: hypothetical protein VGL99_28910 [Chloroflexota bacterium]|jgi:hypothetical protein
MLRWTAFLALVLTMLSTSLVSAQAVPTCPMTPTISALQDCVRHASEQGHITKPGVARSLLAELQVAQSALDRAHTRVAIAILEIFIREVRAQSGRSIEPEHAAHTIDHAQLVIQALRR